MSVKVRYLFSIDIKASGTALSSASLIHVDSYNNELFLVDRTNKRIAITDLEGTFMYQFSFAVAGIKSPKDMVVAKDGKIYFADTDNVVIADYDGRFIKNLDVSHVPRKGKIAFQSVAINEKYLFVGEAYESRVLVFDVETHEFITEYREGLGVGISLALDKDGIYALDPGSFSVYHLDMEGNPKGRFGKISGLPGGFSMPTDIDVNGITGRVAVVDVNRIAIIFFDLEGNFLYEFGGAEMFS